MKEADQAIAEIRAVRHRISAEHSHEIRKYIASLREQETHYANQIMLYKRLESEPKEDATLLRDKPLQ